MICFDSIQNLVLLWYSLFSWIRNQENIIGLYSIKQLKKVLDLDRLLNCQFYAEPNLKEFLKNK